MFSEIYTKFKSFFEEGTSIYVEGEYKQRYNSDEIEFKVLNVRLLETIGEEKTQSVTLKISIEKISAGFIEQIEKPELTGRGGPAGVAGSGGSASAARLTSSSPESMEDCTR